MPLRPERSGDEDAISALTTAAFRGLPYASGTEAQIIERLRVKGALTLSLVDSRAEILIGHIAFSPVTIDEIEIGWYGLGPVSVAPEYQGRGAGSALVVEGLNRLRILGAMGCVLLGAQRFYSRFGFERTNGLVYPGAPPEDFLALSFTGAVPEGTVKFHPAFYES